MEVATKVVEVRSIISCMEPDSLTCQTKATTAVVDSTTLEADNPTAAEDTTIRREAAAAAVVAAGNSIMGETAHGLHSLRTQIQRAEGQTVLQTILTDGSGQERMGGKTLVAGITFGS